ncbi:phasin family protein [Hansschlegelia zhihuaiae]|uniref:Phasin n=1 Tax=Hansschlegelia zhihuaiae TaxID=405005 RepID=A0A4Q0M3Q8_9HYPH|nr:phasin family protein [Hansschlegelia zhihuaiae]RXF67547.1 phasin [Hansschlegelia zhihuaiae]
MANPGDAHGGYQIPNEMRDFADKSVEQARKAFDGFLDAAYKASNAFENQTNSAQDNMRTVAGAAVSFAEQNMTASFAYAQKLVRAKTVEEVIAIQTEFAKAQVEALTKQMNELGAVAGRRVDTKR